MAKTSADTYFLCVGYTQLYRPIVGLNNVFSVQIMKCGAHSQSAWKDNEFGKSWTIRIRVLLILTLKTSPSILLGTPPSPVTRPWIMKAFQHLYEMILRTILVCYLVILRFPVRPNGHFLKTRAIQKLLFSSKWDMNLQHMSWSFTGVYPWGARGHGPFTFLQNANFENSLYFPYPFKYR